MKRWIALLLVLAMCLGMCGCENKSESVKYTEAVLDAIGTVDPGSGEALRAAWDAYLALPEEEQAAVLNYETLLAAQAIYDSYFEKVEITSENWQEYFVAEQPYFWGEDAFGEVNSVSAPLQVRVTDAYANRIIFDAGSLVVCYDEESWIWKCTVDWENRSIELTQRDYYIGSSTGIWRSENPTETKGRLAKQYEQQYDDGNMLAYVFSSCGENKKLPEVGAKREYVELSTFTVTAIAGTISVLKPEYEPHIPEKKEAVEVPVEIEGYTPVELTMDNWQDYLELRCDAEWKTDAEGNIESYVEDCDLYVKEEWMDRVKSSLGTNVQVQFTAERTKVFYDVDWNARVFTMGGQFKSSVQQEVYVEVFPGDEYYEYNIVNFDPEWPLIDGVVRIYVPRDESFNVEKDKKTGKMYTSYAETTVTKISGTLYIKDE